MNVSVRWRRRGWLALGFALLWVVNQFLPLIPNPYFGTRLKWQETLTLSSGEQVRVGRNVKFTSSCSIGGNPCSARKFDWSRLESRDSPARFPLWDAPLDPILLDRDPQGRLWLIAGTDERGVWLNNGYPDPAYSAFTLKNDRWVLAPLPGEFMNRRTNLLVDFRREDSNRTLARDLLARKARPGGQKVSQHKQAIVERTENNGYDAKSALSDRSLPWRELAKFQE